jgi:hypothetical protein
MNDVFKIALLSSFIPIAESFFNIHNLFPNIITNLEGIITTKAISSSIMSTFRKEFPFNNFMLQFTQLNLHSTNDFYIPILVTYLYGQYRYFKGSESCAIDSKFNKIDKYQKIKRITKEIIFIIFVIFTKNVENAI